MRVMLSIFSWFAALLVLEGVVSAFNIVPPYGYPKGLFQADSDLDYTFTPNFSGETIFEEFKQTVTTNSEGIRDHEYGVKKKNDFRVLTIGDSFTWGAYGVELEQTFVKVLEKKLGAQVINAGVVGYSTDQEFGLLKRLEGIYQPDMVMLAFSAGTDFESNRDSGEMTAKNGFLVGKKFTSQTLEATRNYLLEHLRLYQLLERGVTALFGIPGRFLTRLQEEDRQAYLYRVPPNRDYLLQIEKTKKILSEMKSYLEAKGITLVVTIIPMRYQLDPQNFIKNYISVGGAYDMELPQKTIRQWGQREDILVIDPLPEMRRQADRGLYWRYNPHLTIAGNEVIGSYIYDQLKMKCPMILTSRLCR